MKRKIEVRYRGIGALLAVTLVLLFAIGLVALQRQAAQPGVVEPRSSATIAEIAPPIDPVRETEAAAHFATNTVRLTEEATPGPSATPDLRVFYFASPRRIAGEGVISEVNMMGRFRRFFRANDWTGYFNGQVVHIVAGEGRTPGGSPTGDGKLLISTFERQTGIQVDMKELDGPKGSGQLAILDVDGSRVILSAPHKPILVFDLATLTFWPDEPATALAERKIGEATVTVASPGLAGSPQPGVEWQVTLARDTQTVVLTLTDHGQPGEHTLTMGSGQTSVEAERQAWSVTTEGLTYNPRIFDVRGDYVLFANFSNAIYALNLTTGEWVNADVLFAAQPDFVATVVPESAILYADSTSGRPTGSPAPAVTGYP